MTIKNEEYWADIESKNFMAREDLPSYPLAWEWLEKLEQGGQLRQIDIIQLEGLLDAVYRLGVESDK